MHDVVSEDRGFSRRLARLLISRNYALLSFGQFVSNLGDFVFDTTLILWIAVQLAPGKTWAPLAVSGVLAAATLPSFVSPVIGVFVDRWDRRQTMLWADIVRALLLTLLILTTGAVTPDLRIPTAWHLAAIYTTVLLAATCTRFFQPARTAIIQDIVDPVRRPQATSIVLTLRSLASLAGPPLAAPLLFGIGVQWALAVDALSFLVSFVAILAVHVPPQESRTVETRTGVFSEMSEGLRFYAENRVLRVLTVTTVVILLGAGATSALGVFFLTENLHTPARFFGFMGTANALGILAGALIAGRIVARLGMLRTFYVTLTAVGLIILVYSRSTTFPMALAVDFFIGLTAGVLNVPLVPIIMAVTPRHLIGRVFSVFGPLLDVATLISVALAGYLVSLFSPGEHVRFGFLVFGRVDTVFAVSGALSVLAGLYAFRGLASVSLPEDADHHDQGTS